MRKVLILFSILIMFQLNCKTWIKTTHYYSSTEKGFSVNFPDGWMQYDAPKFTIVTRDGIRLQNIRIHRWSLDVELKYTKKKLTKNMLAKELAELIVDNISSSPAFLNFKLLDNSPITLANKQGFRVLYHYKNRDGLKMNSICCGFLHNNWYYQIQYTAAQRYYFKKDLKTFEKMLKSFRVE